MSGHPSAPTNVTKGMRCDDADCMHPDCDCWDRKRKNDPSLLRQQLADTQAKLEAAEREVERSNNALLSCKGLLELHTGPDDEIAQIAIRHAIEALTQEDKGDE